MNLHTLKTIKTSTGKRIGRGGKRGTTSGRGTKGQHSRSGHRIRPAIRDLIQRLPKKRGFRNKPISAPAITIKLGSLVKKLEARGEKKAIVTLALLKAIGMIPMRVQTTVKILGDKTTLTMPITVDGILVSASGKKQIEAAGGSVRY
jgi:large subunit ribosomal protein L15